MFAVSLASFAVTLVLNEALVVVNEPEIPAAVIPSNLVPSAATSLPSTVPVTVIFPVTPRVLLVVICSFSSSTVSKVEFPTLDISPVNILKVPPAKSPLALK